jgi:ABC-type sugar transport system ATPase subunit
MPTVELRDVRKQYDRVEAVRGISFKCRADEFVVILGPSGAGKTSTLKMVAGLEAITGGEILLDGRCVNEIPPGERGVAMVFESYALYPHFTVFENLAFPLQSKAFRLTGAEIKTRVQETAELLQIAPLLERKPAELSGGQKQRVSLGRALVRKAGLLLMDEPLSHLDANLRHHMRRELKKMHAARQSTVLYVTHDYLEALALADLLVVLDRGMIRQIGTPAEVYQSPADTFVASLLGHPKINLIPAKIKSSGADTARLVLESGAGLLAVPDTFLSVLHGQTEVIVGIRPQHLRPAEEGIENGWCGEVYVNENLGYRNLVEIKIGPERLHVLCRNANCAIGERICVVPPETRILLFDKATGRNLMPSRD